MHAQPVWIHLASARARCHSSLVLIIVVCSVSGFSVRSLFDVLRKAGRVDMRLARSVAISVARGMAYLHSRQPPILHKVGTQRRLVHGCGLLLPLRACHNGFFWGGLGPLSGRVGAVACLFKLEVIWAAGMGHAGL